MKNWTFILVASAIALPTVCGHADEPKPDRKKVDELMQAKLKASQKVLEGIATDNPELIAKGAETLMRISKEAEWKILKTPKYEIFSNDFRRNAESLIQNAKDKNLDGATLAYVDLTMSCVKCHKHVREVRMTRKD